MTPEQGERTNGDGLVEFLLARITEDEAEARLATTIIAAPNGLVAFPETATCSSAPTRTLSMDRHRLLDECEAKRKLIRDYNEPGRTSRFCLDDMDVMDYVFAVLASVYAAHPDYDEEWRP